MLCIDAVWFLQNTAHMYWLVATPSHSAKAACHCMNVSFCVYRTPASPCVSRCVSRSILPKQHVSSESNIRGHDPAWHDDAPHTSSTIYAAVSGICEVRFWDIGIFVSLWMHSTEHPLFCRDTFVAPTHIQTPAGLGNTCVPISYIPTFLLCSPDPITSTWIWGIYFCVSPSLWTPPSARGWLTAS